MNRIILLISITSLMNISYSFANENNFTNACQQQLMLGNSAFLSQVKKQKPEYYEDVLKSVKDETEAMCSCIASNFNEHLEIAGIDKDSSFQQIALSFETGYRYHSTRNLRKMLGLASVPCIIQ